MLKEHDFKDRAEFSKAIFMSMKKYGGIGLTANQVGMLFRMFIMGNHLSLENGEKHICFNPKISFKSDDDIMMREGCLTFCIYF